MGGLAQVGGQQAGGSGAGQDRGGRIVQGPEGQGDDVAAGQAPSGGEQLQAGAGGGGLRLGGLEVDEHEDGGIEHGNQLLSRVV